MTERAKWNNELITTLVVFITEYRHQGKAIGGFLKKDHWAAAVANFKRQVI